MEIDPSIFLENIVCSMPNRVKVVIENDGEYSGTSISGGAGTANTLINPHSPVIHVQKRQNIIEYFCHLTVQTTKTVYLMALYREYT